MIFGVAQIKFSVGWTSACSCECNEAKIVRRAEFYPAPLLAKQ
ncbi:hypothetical protein [uncultured Campylobacter sp.]